MSRNPHSLQAFVLADELAVDGSASEVRYLLGLAGRLDFGVRHDFELLIDGYGRVIRALQSLLASFRSPEARRPRPEAP